MTNFPFCIKEIVALLPLTLRREKSVGAYINCPFCGDNRGKLWVNYEHDIFRCNYCNESGGMLALYGRLNGIYNNSDVYHELCSKLRRSRYSSGSTAQAVQMQVKKEAAPTHIEQAPRATPEQIHQTYHMLLDLLALRELHRTNLQSRGFSDEQIAFCGYRSTPSYWHCLGIAQSLISRGCTIRGVPGFYRNKSGKWTMAFYSRTAGFLVPIRGIDGLIQGIQVRLDVPIKDEQAPDKAGAKYLWFSSGGKPMGCSSGSPTHFVGNPHARVVYVTEGALKGDVSHFLMNRTFACVQGANNLSQFEALLPTLMRYGTEEIVEAHDMDKFHNEAVQKGALKIIALAHAHGLQANSLVWNPDYNGVDEWQLALRNCFAKSVYDAA